MLISYGIIGFFLNRAVLRPQENRLAACKEEKNRVEYEYLKLKNTPEFVSVVGKTVGLAQKTLSEFSWLQEECDPNLLCFKRVSEAADNAGVAFVRFERLDAQETTKYYVWKADFQGPFYRVCDLLRALEEDPRYLKIDAIEVQSGEEAPLVRTTILGIRHME